MKNSSMKKSDLIILIVSCILTILNMLIYTKLANITKWLNLTLILTSILLIILMFLFFSFEKTSYFRTCFLILCIISFITYIYALCVILGYEHIFSSVSSMQEFIKSTGAWGMIVFVLIQFLQATIVPIPAMITTIAGAVLFGPTTAMILSLIGILLASFVSFFVGRVFGAKVVSWIIGDENYQKYSNLLYDKGKYTFFLMQVFPFFPDDILCLIAGTTKMSLKFFTITMLIARPLAIIPTCYLGGGTIIPYSGWGLIVWGFLIVFMIAMFILSYKYQDKIEKFVTHLSKKFTKNKDSNNLDEKNTET